MYWYNEIIHKTAIKNDAKMCKSAGADILNLRAFEIL